MVFLGHFLLSVHLDFVFVLNKTHVSEWLMSNAFWELTRFIFFLSKTIFPFVEVYNLLFDVFPPFLGSTWKMEQKKDTISNTCNLQTQENATKFLICTFIYPPRHAVFSYM